MKFAIVVLACLIAAAHAQYNPFGFDLKPGQYNPSKQYNYNRSPYKQYNTPSPYRFTNAAPTIAPVTYSPVVVTTQAPSPYNVAARVSSGDRSAIIVKSANEINPDGSFNYYFETNNGIAAQEVGTPRDFGGNPPVVPVVTQGSFSWTSPEGKPITISYIADENGYQPQGDAIPTPPPVPAQIARALEYIARNYPQK